MSKTEKRLGVRAATLLLASVLTGCVTPSPTPPPSPPPSTTTYLERLQNYAAILNNSVAQNQPNELVIPAASTYHVGDVLGHLGATVEGSCPIPANDFPDSDYGIEWTPAVGSQSQFSASAGLPLPIASNTVQLSASGNTGKSVSLDFESLTRHEAYRLPFGQVLKSQSCATIINGALTENEGQPVTVVEGTISGIEKYDFSQASNLSIGAAIASFFHVTATASNGATPSAFEETRPSVHFLITYNISQPVVPIVPSEAAAPAPAPATPPAGPVAPSPIVVKGLQSTIAVAKPPLAASVMAQ